MGITLGLSRAPSRVAALLVTAFTALAAHAASADVFIEVGAQAARVEATIALQDDKITEDESGWHLGIGASRAFGMRNEIGVRIELDSIGSDLLLAVRALDYRRHLNERIALGAFVGAARLDLATPAYGYYLGGGVHFKDVVASWDLGIDLRFGDKVARDNLLPTDPRGGSPDNFYDITGISLYLRHTF